MRKTYACLAIIFLLASTSVMAGEYYNSYENNNNIGETHYVRPYVKEDGTFVEGHRSGNPGSGVHCHGYSCY